METNRIEQEWGELHNAAETLARDILGLQTTASDDLTRLATLARLATARKRIDEARQVLTGTSMTEEQHVARVARAMLLEEVESLKGVIASTRARTLGDREVYRDYQEKVHGLKRMLLQQLPPEPCD